ncbi:tail fiber protein [Bacillus phage Mater]|uniref:Tail fiber protein n=1 Tax=Bacillus phage Mater TaxID=1540090 RepID=A0A0A0RMM9_9CAUD|nr:tail fiber protein [Bacillus phage Mater]AIW03320.1 tail fiber protein [Bacillus phage Mater]
MDNGFDQFMTPLSPIRFQAQLGKETKRMYKEGQNVVKLSLARVIKVNYKYNTVEVITTLHKNSTVKNPSDNGKFSARLPVAFGGTTPEGKVYGSNTLVTIGSLVLIGFMEGNKDHPIVLNIYGDTHNQSRLTRTTFASADESDEELQRELWQLFTLYPSMTYKNTDGNGNQEITFSGKSFMYITDTDPDNDYVNDSEFEYDLLPSAHYADGELIEPKSPQAPTVLYVHQGIYDNHRVTFFIKSDGTVRLGSRHTSGTGVTFMEMTTSGAFQVFQKKDTTDPEDESEKYSKFGIEEDGAVVLESPEHRLEVNEEGVFIDGKPIASFGGGGDGTSLDDLIDEVDKVKASIEVVDGKIESKVESEQYSKDLADVNQKVAEVVDHVADVTDRLNGVETKVTYSAKIVSTNGTTLGAGETSTILFANILQSGDDITNSVDAAKFIWTRVSDNATADATWNNAHKAGAKSITVTQADVSSRAIFNVDVVTDTFDVTGQIAITDAADTPITDDPTKLNRYRRALTRAELAVIVGRFLDSTEAMPTIAQMDANGLGQVYQLRRDAKSVGMASMNTLYVNFENAYMGLKTYLESITPKPWDISSSTVTSINSATWQAKWDEYRLRYTMLNVEVEKRKAEYAAAIGEQYVNEAIKRVSQSEQFENAPITKPMNITSPIASVGLPEFQGRHIISTGDSGNRILPITSPSFTTGGTLTIYSKFYGDGTVNDSFSWNKQGQAVKVKRWEDNDLSGDDNWALEADRTGYKIVKISNYTPSVISNSALAANFNREMLTTVGDITAADQVKLVDTDKTLYISIKDTATGWGESYTPSVDEIKAFFYGWKMCNGTINTPYTGTGNKVWYPFGDTDLKRSTRSSDGTTYNPVPTSMSPTVVEQTMPQYQVVHRLVDAVEETVQFDGILPLIAGDNNVDITYPVDTPEITNGFIRYALNLATVTDTLKYIIPVLQKRLSSAEQVITDDAIRNTVMQSIEYQFDLGNKADKSDLTKYATGDDVDAKVKAGLDSLDFKPYITQSQLDQTAFDITAKFSTGNGVNIIKNSIGYAGLDFWTLDPNDGVVDTINNVELDTLGFGSGFLFVPDGKDKGIIQELAVIPNQPYTLSWYLNKRTGGPDSSYRFAIQIIEGDVIKKEISDNSSAVTNGYEGSYFTYTPESETVKVRFVGYGNVDATLTGAMLSIGDIPLKWSLATGEVYNTNVRMDIKGIRVSQLDADKKEVGYTQITPQEFAGYSRNELGSFKKVFYQNGDETVATKLRAEEEINMGSIKILNINSGGYSGWAFVPNLD